MKRKVILQIASMKKLLGIKGNPQPGEMFNKLKEATTEKELEAKPAKVDLSIKGLI